MLHAKAVSCLTMKISLLLNAGNERGFLDGKAVQDP